MEDHNERIEAFKKAQSPDELVQLIYNFLEDIGWTEEYRDREHELNNLGDLTLDLKLTG